MNWVIWAEVFFLWVIRRKHMIFPITWESSLQSRIFFNSLPVELLSQLHSSLPLQKYAGNRDRTTYFFYVASHDRIRLPHASGKSVFFRQCHPLGCLHCWPLYNFTIFIHYKKVLFCCLYILINCQQKTWHKTIFI